MQKKIVFLTACILASFAFTSANMPDETTASLKLKTATPLIRNIPTSLSMEEKIENLYDEFSMQNRSMPSLVAFQNAMLGYYKLVKEGKIENEILTIVDFSLSSAEKRMWILDMESQKVLFHTFVAHGENTGVEMATNFSNVENSHKSSLGFYLTAETYFGKHGLSLRLDGLEKGFNSNARSRYIVVHGADYATSNFVESQGRLGRSWGCPAVPPKVSEDIIKTIKEKSCFFIYYPSEKYLNNSIFLNS